MILPSTKIAIAASVVDNYFSYKELPYSGNLAYSLNKRKGVCSDYSFMMDYFLRKLGFATKQFCKKLLKNGMVHFVATDAHDTAKRSPQLHDCAKYISKKYGEEYMRQLLYHNPQRIIQNEYI